MTSFAFETRQLLRRE